MNNSILFFFFLVTFSKSFSKVSKEISTRIAGGHQATPHSMPYQAFIKVKTQYFGDKDCGGSLISPNYILTSASCVYLPLNITVRLGVHNNSKFEESRVDYVINEVTIHEDYINNGDRYNIAALRLPKAVRLTPAIRIIPLPRKEDVDKKYVGALATISGWGSVIDCHHNEEDVLNYFQVKVISNENCPGFSETLIFCTNNNGSGDLVRICLQDIGGPLVTDGVLIGIAFYGRFSACSEDPAGFTRVTSYLDWLANNTDAIIN